MTGARPILDADFPGYAQAVAREALVRGIACLGAPEKICGYDVQPLNAWHVRWLALNRSPFLVPNPVEWFCSQPDIVGDISRFLWIVSPWFKPGSKPSASAWRRRLNRMTLGLTETRRDRFNRQFAGIMEQPVDVVCRQILSYMEESYLDAESASAGEKTYYEFEVAIAHEMNSAYGLPLDFWVMGWWRNFCRFTMGQPNPVLIPLKLVFQLRKCHRHSTDPRAILSNRSEQIELEGLRRLSQRARDAHNLAQYVLELERRPAPDLRSIPSSRDRNGTEYESN